MYVCVVCVRVMGACACLYVCEALAVFSAVCKRKIALTVGMLPDQKMKTRLPVSI